MVMEFLSSLWIPRNVGVSDRIDSNWSKQTKGPLSVGRWGEPQSGHSRGISEERGLPGLPSRRQLHAHPMASSPSR